MPLERGNLQALTELIKFTLGVEVFAVDGARVAIAGTGPYKPNVGTKRPQDSYVHVTISCGDTQIVTEPRYTRQCYRCEYRCLCPYFMVVCCPLAKKSQVKGLLGFLAFSEDQRQVMIHYSSLLCILADKLNHAWEAERSGFSRFLNHPSMKTLIDLFEDGLILTTPDYKVLILNQQAEHLLRVKATDLKNKHLPTVLEAYKGGNSRMNPTLDWNMRKGDYPLTDGKNVVGRMILLPKESKRKWSLNRYRESSISLPTMVGSSPAMIQLCELVAKVAKSNSTVLIIGETGVGKELIARYIHYASPRRSGPFVTINCAAIPDSLFESEIFGYASGAFTGADAKGKVGRFEAAHGGTLFLDEVSRLSLQNQAKILRVLEDGVIQRLGEERQKRVNVRILAATNSNLEKAVAENRFLPDLYYRLAVVPVYVPPLRERIEDIPLLLEYYQKELRKSVVNDDFRGFAPRTMSYLLKYRWPGNVRELKNLVEYVLNTVHGRQVQIEDLPIRNEMDSVTTMPSKSLPSLYELEKRQIQLALKIFGSSTEGKRKAAKHLGISLSTLYRKLARMDQ